MRISSNACLMIGMAYRIASGVSSRLALYSGKISCRKVGSDRSSATAKWVGSCFFCISKSVLRNPKMAETSSPDEVIRGLRIKAK